MTWNYRIIKHDSQKPIFFAIHEVFYNDKGRISSWTENPIDVVGDSKVDIKSILMQMTLEIETPVLKESELLEILNSNSSKMNSNP